MSNPLVMYIVLRRDLLSILKWPTGAVMAQVCHASTAVLWSHKEDSDVVEYMNDIDSMRKVVLEISDEIELKKISESLSNANIHHKLWIEQPENIATCISVKPYRKKDVHKYLKHLSLFS